MAGVAATVLAPVVEKFAEEGANKLFNGDGSHFCDLGTTVWDTAKKQCVSRSYANPCGFGAHLVGSICMNAEGEGVVAPTTQYAPGPYAARVTHSPGGVLGVAPPPQSFGAQHKNTVVERFRSLL